MYVFLATYGLKFQGVKYTYFTVLPNCVKKNSRIKFLRSNFQPRLASVVNLKFCGRKFSWSCSNLQNPQYQAIQFPQPIILLIPFCIAIPTSSYMLYIIVIIIFVVICTPDILHVQSDSKVLVSRSGHHLRLDMPFNAQVLNTSGEPE